MQTEQMDTQDQASTPLISFVVTAYNLPAGLLSECVDSIMAVDMGGAGREVIVVDDGSDEPVAAMRPGVSVIRQSHAGPGAARNCGIDAARGRYIQFVDGDDFLLPPEYNHCVALLQDKCPDMVVFSFCAGGQLSLMLSDSAPTTGLRYMRRHVFAGQVWRYAVRRELLDGLRFPTDVANHEDELFTSLLLPRVGTLIATTAEAYYYRRRDGSLTTAEALTEKDRSQADFINVITKLQEVSRAANGELRQALAHRVGQLSIDYLITSAKLYHDPDKMKFDADRLGHVGLYPPPLGWYGLRYLMLSMLVRCRWGKKVIIRVIGGPRR